MSDQVTSSTSGTHRPLDFTPTAGGDVAVIYALLGTWEDWVITLDDADAPLPTSTTERCGRTSMRWRSRSGPSEFAVSCVAMTAADQVRAETSAPCASLVTGAATTEAAGTRGGLVPPGGGGSASPPRSPW